MMDDERLFDMEEIPIVPLLREPARRKGESDARFRNEYPPSWHQCQTCWGSGKTTPAPFVRVPEEMSILYAGVRRSGVEFTPHRGDDWATMQALERAGQIEIVRPEPVPCPDCLGMGSLKARVRLEAEHRCVRCGHPYMPKGDAKMLGVEPSGIHECGNCQGHGYLDTAHIARCPDCKGAGRVWTPWSSCDERCLHGGPARDLQHPFDGLGVGVTTGALIAEAREQGYERTIEAEWRILTVHHLDGDKANVRWWNLMAACQRCHLAIQAKVVMERVYPHEHSSWFQPYVAGYYAKVYLGEELTREETMARLDDLLALERA